MQKKQKSKKWCKFRHKIVRDIVNVILTPYCRLKYGFKARRFKEQGKRQYLVLFNHQTAFDQFFVGMVVKGAVYYLGSEDLFSNGFVSSLIKYLIAPIPIKKQATDPRAVLNAMRVAKEGGTIAMAPEGNRTYSGKTEYINPAVAPFAKKLKLPIALLRIEGGYGTQPRWSNVVRKGKSTAYVSRVLEPEEYLELSNDELCKIINDELYVNEAVLDYEYKSKRSAEYLERAIYVCPTCGLSTFETSKDIIECKKCGKKVRYLPTKQLRGIGFDFPFEFVNDWYEYQSDFVNRLDTLSNLDKPYFNDIVCVKEVIPYDKKITLFKEAKLCLYGDKITVCAIEGSLKFDYDCVSAVAVLGRNKLNVYVNGKIYQFKGNERFNALKYVNFYYRFKNIRKGDENGKFLGL